MAYVAVSASPIRVHRRGPVDPGYGIGIERPDQGLPGDQHPDQGLPGFQPYPDHGLPLPPPVWPPPVPAHPIVIAPPGTPPGTIWPPVINNSLPGGQPYPDQGLPGSQPGPDQGLPGGQPHPDQGLPVGGQGEVYWVVVWIPGYDWKYVAVDPSLSVRNPIAPTPAPKDPRSGREQS